MQKQPGNTEKEKFMKRDQPSQLLKYTINLDCLSTYSYWWIIDKQTSGIKQKVPKIDPNTNGNLICDKHDISNFLGKDGQFNKYWWKNWFAIWRKTKLEPSLTL